MPNGIIKMHQINWTTVSSYRYLSEKFIRKHKHGRDATTITVENNYIPELVARIEGPKGSSTTGFDLSKIGSETLKGAGTGAAIGTPFAIASGPAWPATETAFTLGGGLAGGAEELARQLGWSPAAEFGLGMAASTPAGPMTKMGGRMLERGGQTISGLLQGDIPKAWGGVKGLVKETPQEIERRTAAEQQRQFGKPTLGYVEGAPTKQFSNIIAQKGLFFHQFR